MAISCIQAWLHSSMWLPVSLDGSAHLKLRSSAVVHKCTEIKEINGLLVSFCNKKECWKYITVHKKSNISKPLIQNSSWFFKHLGYCIAWNYVSLFSSLSLRCLGFYCSFLCSRFSFTNILIFNFCRAIAVANCDLSICPNSSSSYFPASLLKLIAFLDSSMATVRLVKSYLKNSIATLWLQSNTGRKEMGLDVLLYMP